MKPIKCFDFLYRGQNFKCQLYPLSPQNKPNISLSITPNQIIKIKAPLKTSHTHILKTLYTFAEWIYTHPAYQEPALYYINFEEHLYLGQAYPLRIIEDINQKQTIELIHNHIVVSVRKNYPLRIYSLLNHWYKFQAIQIFSERFSIYKTKVPSINWEINLPLLKIKKMKSQWGSYNRRKNVITLNQHLIKANIFAIDYVIIHELCHMIEFNHGKKFYHLITSIMPDWKKWHDYLYQHHYILNRDQQPCENHFAYS